MWEFGLAVVFHDRGYSGKGIGKNNPAMDNVANVGPIPRGRYTIAELIEHTDAHGPYVLRLEPDPANDMHGRSGFLIHGDSEAHPGEASEGCIILPRPVREKIWTSGIRTLLVTCY